MTEPQSNLDLLRARVVWRVERPMAELSQTAALEAASRALGKERANVEVEASPRRLRFGYSLRASRSWLACIWAGSVTAHENAERLVVAISASLLPLLVYGVLGVIAIGLAGLGPGWMVVVGGLLIAGNYVFVHLGLGRIAAAVATEASAARAA